MTGKVLLIFFFFKSLNFRSQKKGASPRNEIECLDFFSYPIYGGHLVTEEAKLSWSHIYMDFVNTIYDDWNNIID